MLKTILFSILVSGAIYAQTDAGEAKSVRRKTYSEYMPKDVVELYQSNIHELKDSGMEKQSLKVGKQTPKVSFNLGGKNVPIEQIYAAGPLVIKFYRGGWCVPCIQELKDYDKLLPEFKKVGSQVIAISPDTAQMTSKTDSKNHFGFDLVSDEGGAIARQFGLVYKADPKILEHMKKNGIDLSDYQGKSANGELSMPGTFVVSSKGIIAFSFVDADYRVRAEPRQVLEVIERLQKMNGK